MVLRRERHERVDRLELAAEQVEGHLRAGDVGDDQVEGERTRDRAGEHPVDRRRRPAGRLDDQRGRGRLLGLLQPRRSRRGSARAARAGSRSAIGRRDEQGRDPVAELEVLVGPADAHRHEARRGARGPARRGARTAAAAPPAATERMTSLTVASVVAAHRLQQRRARCRRRRPGGRGRSPALRKVRGAVGPLAASLAKPSAVCITRAAVERGIVSASRAALRAARSGLVIRSRRRRGRRAAPGSARRAPSARRRAPSRSRPCSGRG